MAKNHRGQAGKVLSGKLSHGTVLHQGSRSDRQGSAVAKDLEDRREHEHPTVHPLSAGRSMSSAKYRRLLLKVSGEMLAGEQGYGIQPSILEGLAEEIASVTALDIQVAVVIGGGNIFRGIAASASGMERASADYMGMLATVLNALALQNALERVGVMTRVQSAIEMRQLAEGYIRRRAIRHLEKKRVVIFAGGTGNPYFTTDTAAALRALEIGAEAILMGKNGVDGVYDGDPDENPDATFLPELTHREALERGLKVMDSTALSLCMDNNLPIHVFGLDDERNIGRVVRGERIGTIISTARREE